MNIAIKISALAKERNAVILAHNYQRPEVQDIAHFTGDSLELSIKAKETDAKVIVFCGVHFMAETAKILSPRKTVVMPRSDAGCPMADMVTPEGIEAEKAKHPGFKVVTYVNSTAAVKALSDACCTSSNAVSIVKNIDSEKILFVPDKNLANYVSRFVKKEIVPWKGFCPTHERLRPEDIFDRKKEYPGATVLVHPECRPEVVDLADKALSTSGILKFCRESDAKVFIIGTEEGILHRMRKENPGKTFVLASDKLVCPNMKLTAIEDVLSVLENLDNRIEVPEQVIERARKALELMYTLNR